MKRIHGVALTALIGTGMAFGDKASVRTVHERPLLVGVVERCPESDLVELQRAYTVAMERAGHIPVVIPRTEGREAIRKILGKIDLVLLTGGPDVEPERYGGGSKELCKTNPIRDEFEWMLLEEARAMRKPIFGICRGMQIMNAFFGGTLYQDLPSQYVPVKGAAKVAHRTPKGAVANHVVRIVPDTRLAEVLGDGDFMVRSSHHQAVKKLAPGFRVSAVAPDGVVEAIEAVDYPAAAVQFHPEKMVGQEDFDQKRLMSLLRRLPDLCK